MQYNGYFLLNSGSSPFKVPNYILGESFWGKRIKKNSTDILRRTTLDVCQLVLKAKKPLGTRGIQKALKLSSPSIAYYNLMRLRMRDY
jgi:hypothetical protein